MFAYGSSLTKNNFHGLGSFLIRNAIHFGMGNLSGAWNNLGLCYFRLGLFEAAVNCYEKAIAQDPKNAEAFANLAGIYINTGQPHLVEKYGRESVALDPTNPHGNLHLSMGLLEQGRFAEAWPHWAYRWETSERIGNKRPYKAPKWKGENVKKLAIHGEQGVGDEILFCSRLNEAMRRVGSVAVECMDRLVPLFRRTWPEHRFYKDHATLIDAEGEPDAYCAMGDLFDICGLPNGKPYLARPPRDDILVDQERIRVGLAWRGGTPYTNKRERTTQLSDWASILNVPGVEFVSVQYDRDNALDEAKQAGLKIEVTSRDVGECAKAIAGCDLVISVCQTAVHLAGAMGVPCWTLVPKRCAWRYAPWMGDQCAWYDSVRFYRQDDSEKWPPVIERIANDLRSFYG